MANMFHYFDSSHVKCFLFGAVAGTSIYLLIKKMYGKNELDVTPDECFLFSPGKIDLNICISKNYKICDTFACSYCNYKKFVRHIESAESSLLICVYLLTFSDLSDSIIKVFKKGIVVKIIMDKQMSDEANQSKFHFFLKHHVPILLVDAPDIMHNKFVIVDEKKVIFGSFNFTKHALRNNYESGAVIHNSEIVHNFLKYFEYLWLNCPR